VDKGTTQLTLYALTALAAKGQPSHPSKKTRKKFTEEKTTLTFLEKYFDLHHEVIWNVSQHTLRE